MPDRIEKLSELLHNIDSYINGADDKEMEIDDLHTYLDKKKAIDKTQNQIKKPKDSANKFEISFRKSPVGMMIVKFDGTVIEANDRVCTLLEHAEEEIYGRKITQFIEHNDIKKFVSLLDEVVSLKSPHNEEIRLLKKSGNILHIKLFVSPVEVVKNDMNFVVTLNDIGQQKELEDQLKESERMYKAVVEQSAENIFLVDIDTRKVIQANKSISDMLGYSREEFDGISIYDFIAHSRDNLDQLTRKLTESQKIHLSERRYRKKDGKYIDVEVNASLISYTGKQVICVVSRDITSKKKEEESLKDQKAFMARIIEDLPIGAFAKDITDDFKYILWNKSLTEYLGYSANDVIGKNDFELFDINEAVSFRKSDMAVILEEKPFLINDLKMKTRTGDITAYIMKVPLRSEDGKIQWILGILKDVTDLKKIEEELKKSLAERDAIFNAMSDNMVLLNKDLKQQEILTGQDITDFGLISKLSAHDKAGLKKAVEYALSIGQVQKFEFKIQKSTEEMAWYEAILSPIHIPNRTHRHVVFIAFDVTMRQLNEEVLRKANTMAEEANKIKYEFLANINHELRTPLNPIIGFTNLLLDEFELEEEAVEFLNIINNSAKNMLNIIEYLIDMSKIVSGNIKPNFSVFSLRGFFSDTAERLQKNAAKNNCNIKTMVHSSIPDQVIGDSNKLLQIFENLVANSVKFSDKSAGDIVLQAEPFDQSEWETYATEPDSAKYYIKFMVVDNGIGIEQEIQERIFDLFTQADSSSTRKFGGTGLGLTIVNKLIDLLRGYITLDSSPGQGTTIKFVLPFDIFKKEKKINNRSEIKMSRTEDADKKAVYNVLIAEDENTNRVLLERIFMNYPEFATEYAMNGREALEKFKNGEFEYVLMDVKMPEMDGLEATRQIRAYEKENGVEKASVIIGVTAHATIGSRERMIEAGMNDVIFKPLILDDFFRIIEKHI